jgi:ubiquilin
MRNHDRTLSNIESIPGGMSALSSMYHSLQQEESALSDVPGTTDESNRAFAERLGVDLDQRVSSDSGPNQTALPNPWAPPPPRQPSRNSFPSSGIGMPSQSMMNPFAFGSPSPTNVRSYLSMFFSFVDFVF